MRALACLNYVLLFLPCPAIGARPAALERVILGPHDDETANRTTDGAFREISPLCSVIDGTGSADDYPCNCGTAVCTEGSWCIASTSQCQAAPKALLRAITKLGTKVFPFIKKILNGKTTDYLVFVEVLPEVVDTLGVDVIPLVDKGLNSSEILVRLSMVDKVLPEAVVKFGTKCTPVLEKAMSDPDTAVRVKVVEEVLPSAIANFGTKAIPLVEKALNDSSATVRKLAAQRVLPQIIAQFGTECIPLVEIALADSNYRVRDVVVYKVLDGLLTEAIEMLGIPALPLLKMALTSADPEVRAAACATGLLAVATNETLSEAFDAANWTRAMSNDPESAVHSAAGVVKRELENQRFNKANEKFIREKKENDTAFKNMVYTVMAMMGAACVPFVCIFLQRRIVGGEAA